jgi:beta-lactamase regulating signal transducer with metallopeptidase domain
LGLIVAVILCVCSSRILREHSPLQITHLAYEHPLSRRIDALCAEHHSLHALNVRVASNCAIPVFTTGWLRPRVIIDACFVQSADDAMLLATLLHESAHVQRRDGLCHLLVKLSFALNPASRWMHEDYMHWRHALEARCDYDAIVNGGEPLALAQSIVAAARFVCGASMPCTSDFGITGDAEISTLKLRLTLLLEGGIAPSQSRGHLIIATVLIAFILLPHLSGSSVLDLWHIEIERLYHLF